MEEIIKLFKSILVDNIDTSIDVNNNIEYIDSGFLFSNDIIHKYSKNDLNSFAKYIKNTYLISKEEVNNTFHKSWNKIKSSSMKTLVKEQIIHYITTYGYEELGIYDKKFVYIPAEKLNIPDIKQDIPLLIVTGITINQLKEKILNMLQSGIALNSETMNDILSTFTYITISFDEIENIKNKEMKSKLYTYFKYVPKNSVEFLRYIVYLATEETLLIKNRNLIEKIKNTKNKSEVLEAFKEYEKNYSLKGLAVIFNRYKPIFLAFKLHKQLNWYINKIRKLSKIYHKPLIKDYMQILTAEMAVQKKLNVPLLKLELEKSNIFRKIKLAYALKFRLNNPYSILYRIRNGKSYAKEYSTNISKLLLKNAYNIVENSIVDTIKKNVENKKIYIPEHFIYSIPTTEKQFIGNIPVGTAIRIDKDLIFGVHWFNVKKNRIDLDLSLINKSIGKLGWDGSYRTQNRNVLFSGDVTDAQLPLGATELFYIKERVNNIFLVSLNYFNYDKNIPVDFKIVIAKNTLQRLPANYIVNPNNIICSVKSSINKHQKVIGIVDSNEETNMFYFIDTHNQNTHTSVVNSVTTHTQKYLIDYYKNSISLNSILEKAGAVFVDSKDECDIDLSYETLEKDTIINLLISN